MKIVLNKNEVRELRKLARAIDNLDGVQTTALKDLADKTVSTKAYILTMLTGEMSIEITEDLVVELLDLTNNFILESTPIFRAIYNLGQALSPMFIKYGERFDKLIEQYQEPVATTAPSIPWEIQSVKVEKVQEMEVC